MNDGEIGELYAEYVTEAVDKGLGDPDRPFTAVQDPDSDSAAVVDRESGEAIMKIVLLAWVAAAVQRVEGQPCGRCGGRQPPKLRSLGVDETPAVVCSDCFLGLDVALEEDLSSLSRIDALADPCRHCGWIGYRLNAKPLFGTASWWDDPGVWDICPSCFQA